MGELRFYKDGFPIAAIAGTKESIVGRKLPACRTDTSESNSFPTNFGLSKIGLFAAAFSLFSFELQTK